MERFAVYFSPREGLALSDFGNRWLGWDAASGRVPDRLPLSGGLTADFVDRVTATPRRYGFHATLKPPFRLAAGTTYGGLVDAVGMLAQKTPPFDIGPVVLTSLGRFLALTPTEAPDALAALARDCVVALDRFRAPPSEDELARRRQASLSARQNAYLSDWGYPYVLEEFRFHMTLSGSLDPADLAQLASVLEPAARPILCDPVRAAGSVSVRRSWRWGELPAARAPPASGRRGITAERVSPGCS